MRTHGLPPFALVRSDLQALQGSNLATFALNVRALHIGVGTVLAADWLSGRGLTAVFGFVDHGLFRRTTKRANE